MLVGSEMYNYYDISDHYEEVVEIYTNRIAFNDKTIGKYLLTNEQYNEAKVIIKQYEVLRFS